ncbi:alpha/beta fold hydrolase [Paenibacillus mendelii]|uniref:Alpha/beta fold hydrolase n=1 Tax=Paenibacillus mendelii TaxID=206163 RepID=A0ABV6J9W3_9BACL|nr:alpha/beta fold hydrolase [Paenibacillus mendelii]MCQ6563900.1 alpha/beta fold hydrolase [Paenibacillus mendelii]
MKKLVTFISAIVLACTLLSGSVSAFNDLDETEKGAILNLKERGIVSGVDSDHFAPRDKINFAQSVSLIVKGINLNIDNASFVKKPEATDYFANVPNHVWYAEAFIIAKMNGLDIPKNVNPKAIITREQYADMLIKALDTKGSFPVEQMPIIFEDADQIDAKYKDSIQRIYLYKIATPDGKPLAYPKQEMTRGEAAVWLHNTIQFMESQTAQTKSGSYASVNGLKMYYEIQGTGEPLILLHGGLGTIDMLFGQLMPALAKTRQVIAVELQAHGHTADIDRPLSYEQMADDTAALIKHLGLDNADVFGFSMGGGVALQTAIRHPDVVRKLVVASTPYKSEGWYPEVLAGMASMNAEAMVGTPIHEVYIKAAPKPEDWPTLIAKMKQFQTKHYDWTKDISAIKAPMLILLGDSDKVRPDHALEMFRLLGGGKADGSMGGLTNAQLAVLPGTTHFNILERTDLLLPIIPPFLDAPMPKVE